MENPADPEIKKSYPVAVEPSGRETLEAEVERVWFQDVGSFLTFDPKDPCFHPTDCGVAID